MQVTDRSSKPHPQLIFYTSNKQDAKIKDRRQTNMMGRGDVYMTRHAARADRQQKWGPLPGHSEEDCELSPDGEASAAELKNKFDSITLAHVVSSPFLRCIQTVLPIAIAKGLQIKIEPGIGEVDSTGFWDANRSALEHNFPIDLQYQPILPRHKLQPEWGDGEAAARSKKTVSAIRENLEGPILFCGHGASCLGIAQAFNGCGYVGYSSFSHFIFDGNVWHVEAMGDVSHLSPRHAKESLASAW